MGPCDWSGDDGVETHTGKPSQQLPWASRKYAVLIDWSPGVTEHGAGVWGWLVVAYVTVSACEFGVGGIFFHAGATIFRAWRSVGTM
jgi:hypothetical protein